MAQKLTVRDRKKQLVRELVYKDVEALHGMKITAFAVKFIAISRILLAIYEIIYFAIAKVEINVVSYLLILPGLLLLYMISDGNRALATITLIAAAIRILLLLASIFTTLPKGAFGVIYLIIALAVLGAQVALSAVISANEKCNRYSIAMRKVNTRIQAEFLAGRR